MAVHLVKVAMHGVLQQWMCIACKKTSYPKNKIVDTEPKGKMCPNCMKTK